MMQRRVGTNSKRVLTLNRSTVLPSVFTDLPPPPQLQGLSWSGVPLLMSLTFGVLDRMDGGKGARPIPG